MNAIILYENRVIGARAYALLEIAASRAGEAGSWRVWLWALEQLGLPSSAGAALDQAIQAHLMVLALQGRVNSSIHLLDWLESWAVRREVQDAALAVFDGGERCPLSPMATPQVSKFAQRHGLSLILGDIETKAERPANSRPGRLDREALAAPGLQWMPEFPSDSPYRRFGMSD